MEKIQVKDLSELPFAADKLLETTGSKGIFAFYGEMGVGKTTLIKEMCKRLGVRDSVNSPTFAIVNEYRTGDDEAVYHFDFYRINTPGEAYDFGYEEYIESGALCLIEWPEKIEPILPNNAVRLFIESNGKGHRTITIND
ncbi:MAG: tRNA (adenosine(37)-N6)-threonylcarbamoyltransferase complex ATPase subunit type 1 TsaE [Rikenellaceae bacterium]|nr:tRNA (adenosine(37)-N6)-threonylcarbamoyltransferase complex ATPase subunit type 1 TsaE [Rikenellaceae bacterium]